MSESHAWGRLQRALEQADALADPEARARAVEKAAGWRRVLDGMRSGLLTIGSRTPVKDTPAWVTLGVAQGGFATGGLPAERPLSADERALAGSRRGLNSFYLSDAGLDRLGALLASGAYAVDTPEQAALPVAWWLLEHDFLSAAARLLGELAPWLDRLALTPRPADPPAPSDGRVQVATVEEVRRRLVTRPVPVAVLRERATLGVWLPLEDRLVTLWVDSGVRERVRVEHYLVFLEDADFVSALPAGWAERRAVWLADYEAALATTPPSRRFTREGSTFDWLLLALRTPRPRHRDLARVRIALRNTEARRGLPGSSELAELRARQAHDASRPLLADLRRVVADRLVGLPQHRGLDSLDGLGQPVRAGESASVPAGADVWPAPTKAYPALRATPAELVERGVITSGETLARVLPQLGGDSVAADLEDPVLRELVARTYQAFRRRRSLLLLNYERQVGFEELPWVAALSVVRGRSGASAAAARTLLTEAVRLALTGFPAAILPNPLVRQAAELASLAGLELPLVEEVAADVFMGDFTAKWQRSAGLASRLFAGSLYARYYDLPDEWAEPAPGAKLADDYSATCRRRAAEAGWRGDQRSVAANGAVLEQSQILTTHNVIQLVDALGLRGELGLVDHLGRRCLMAVSALFRQSRTDHHARLVAVKQAAYSVRQALLFLSLDEAAAPVVVRGWAKALDPRLKPVADGLLHVVEGGSFDATGHAVGGDGRRLLGWSVGQHWLLAPAASSRRD